MSKSRLRIILFVLLFVNPLLLSGQIIESGSWTDWLKYVCTNAAGGTTLNRIAKLSGAPSKCVTAGTSDTTGLLGITVAKAGTSGNAEVQRLGLASCDFDGDTVAGDWVQASTTTGGKCHDAGSSQPSSGDSLGRVLSTNVGVGTYDILVDVRPSGGGSPGQMFNAWCAGVVGTGNGTTYVLIPGTNTVSTTTCGMVTVQENPVSFACTAKNMFVRAQGAGAVSGSGVVALFKNGSASTLTCTLGTGLTCNDTTHTVALTTSDAWSVRVTTGQATDTTNGLRVSFQCQ